MLQIDVPQFTLGQVANATGVSVETIRTWYKRGNLTLGMTEGPAGKGLARHVSGRTALVIGIAGALMRMGVAPARAMQAAVSFAHSGTGGSARYSGEQRMPGQLWRAPARTVLALPADESRRGGRGEVLRVDPDLSLDDVLDEYLDGPQIRGGIVLELDELVFSIRRRLGLDDDDAEVPA